MNKQMIGFGHHQMMLEDPKVVQPESIDLVTEARIHNCVVALGFSSIVSDGTEAERAIVSHRLRMPIATAWDLRNQLMLLLPPDNDETLKRVIDQTAPLVGGRNK